MNEIEQIGLIPIITLHQPWAQWVMLGWKPVETRTHAKFKCLNGKRIGIHAGLTWDRDWAKKAGAYLLPEQVAATEKFLRVGGAIIGSAEVVGAEWLENKSSADALIDCGTVKRFGLVLANLQTIEAIPAKGKQGIWYS